MGKGSSIHDPAVYRYVWREKFLIGVCGRFIKEFRMAVQRARRGYSDEDLYDIGTWFLSVVPDMLEQFRDTRHGSPGCLGTNYVNEMGILVNDDCHAEWTKILNKMIFLFREADENQCQRKNPLEAEHDRISEEFTERFGLFGEGLLTEEEKRDSKGGTRMHFASELPEYADIEAQYLNEEEKLRQYREECKDKAFTLFSKWFYHLWD